MSRSAYTLPSATAASTLADWRETQDLQLQQQAENQSQAGTMANTVTNDQNWITVVCQARGGTARQVGIAAYQPQEGKVEVTEILDGIMFGECVCHIARARNSERERELGMEV